MEACQRKSELSPSSHNQAPESDARPQQSSKEKQQVLLQEETSTSMEEVKQAYASVLSENEDLRKRIQVEKEKSDKSQETIQRLEEKISNLESEYQVLRQQALDARPKSTIRQEPESDARPQKSLEEKQQEENQDVLIRAISQDIGFSEGNPIAASVIFKCLLRWRSFEDETTDIFDRLIQTISGAIEFQENNDVVCYWLSNSAALLVLLQRTLKAAGDDKLIPPRRRTMSATLIRRMSQLRASPQSDLLTFFNSRALCGLDELRQVEAKYPALLFKQQLTAYLEKIYGMIRDNLKKEISLVLGQCIQAPRTSRASVVKSGGSANASAQQALIAHWQNIVKSLDSYLSVMRANHVPSFLIRKVFAQTFSFINVQLFNSLLLRRECCSFSNGEFVKAGLAELDQWCNVATEQYLGFSWVELKHLKQAVEFLIIHQKPEMTLNEIINDLCPTLSIQQLYRISTMYWDDKYGTHSVSAEVLSSMRVMMTEESSNAVSTPFLLDDDSSIPFTVDDVSKSLKQVEMIEVDPPPLLRENSGFAFLQQRDD